MPGPRPQSLGGSGAQQPSSKRGWPGLAGGVWVKSHCPHLSLPVHLSVHPQDMVHVSQLSASRLSEEVACGFLSFPQKQTQS